MKKIIIFVKRNIVFVVISIFSIFNIIKFSEIPIISSMPHFITMILLKPKLGTLSYEIFRLLENLSLAYFASLIFYIIVDYIPKQKMANKSFEIIQNKLIRLYSYMSEIIVHINFALNITKDINEIDINDVIKLDDFEIKDTKNYYHSYRIIDGIRDNKCSNTYFNFFIDIPNYSELIKKEIIEIKNMPCAVYVDFEILEILSSIETNDFFLQISHFKDIPLSDDVHIKRFNFGKTYYNFIQSYKKLNKFNFQKHTYYIELMSNDEQKEYIKILAKEMESVSELTKRSGNFNGIYIGNCQL